MYHRDCCAGSEPWLNEEDKVGGQLTSHRGREARAHLDTLQYAHENTQQPQCEPRDDQIPHRPPRLRVQPDRRGARRRRAWFAVRRGHGCSS